VPRPKPATLADIEARKKLTGFFREAPRTKASFDQKVTRSGITPEMHNAARGWDFRLAIKKLGVTNPKERERCNDEVILICLICKVEKQAERQGTPGRNAVALKLAPRWERSRERAQKELSRASSSVGTKKAAEDWQSVPRLPQALEQEAARDLGRPAVTRTDFNGLRKRYESESCNGPYESHALRNAIGRIVAWVAARGNHIPLTKNSPKLVDLVVEVLDAAGIGHPDVRCRGHRARFLQLLKPFVA
jgi:hypothetical protein